MMILWIIGLLAVCFVVVVLVYGLALVGKKSEEWTTDHVPPLTIIDGGKMERQWGEVEIFLRVMGRLPMEKGDTITEKMLEEFIARFAEHPTHGRWVPLAKKMLAEKRKETQLPDYDIGVDLAKKGGDWNGRSAVEKNGTDDGTDVRDDPATDEGHR